MAKSKPKTVAKKAATKTAPAKKPAAKTKPVAKATQKTAGSKVEAKAKPAAKPAPSKSPAVKPSAKAVTKPETTKATGRTSTGKVAPLTSKPAPKPTPTIAKMPPKATRPDTLDDGDDTPAAPKRMGTSGDIFSEEELTTFRNMLNEEKRKILAKARLATASGNIALEKDEMYDEVDLASATVEQNLTLRLLDRDRKLLAEIDHAIDKIDTGDYGFCEGTGEIIPKRRLELRPWTRHSVKYKEQLERMKKSGRGVADEDEAF